MRVCWCGNQKLNSFSPEYTVCQICGTLVSQKSISDDQLEVHNDEIDFYGKQYWLNHQQNDLGYPDIQARSRHDLTERNLHWLSTLLKYQLPSAKILELGCAHGSFVSLMRQIGYDATGLEMSPWVVDFAKSTFNIPVFLGPVENLDTSQQSFDVIALMDVLEHLPDPNATMRHCFNLLKPNGFLLLQLPQYKEDMVYEKLKQTNHPFLSQLKSDEHLYLFSERSVKALFQQLGSEHIYFEPAIFSHYDMFLVASKSARETNTPVQIETTLLESVQGRMALALLDLRKREQALSKAFEESEADRLARFQQIESLRKQFSTLPFLTRWYCKAKKFCERRT